MQSQVCTEIKYKFLKITRNVQSSFRISFNGKVAYLDLYKISEENHDADYIFITHEHKDHLDIESLRKISKESSMFICNKLVAQKVLSEDLVRPENVLIELTSNDHLDLDSFISIDTKPAYNINKFKEGTTLYHPKENDGLGFVITFIKASAENDAEKVKIYNMGDTDFLPKEHIVEGLDILMIPVEGTYVMTSEEAVSANESIKPLISIPMHYDQSAGSIEDAQNFIEKITNEGYLL